MKKLQGLLLGGALALSAASAAIAISFEKKPVKASADMYEVFYIGSQNMVDNPLYTDADGGTAQYFSAQNKLVLTNFHFEDQGYKYDSDYEAYAALYYNLVDQGLTIELVGNSYIKETSNSKIQSMGMLFEDGHPNPLSNIIIQGTGSLTVESSSNAEATYGLYCKYPKLSIKSGTVIAKANVSTAYESCGAHIEYFEMTGGNLTAQSLGAKGDSYGIFADRGSSADSFVVSGGNITCLAGDTINDGCDSVGLYITGLSFDTTVGVQISGGSLHAEAGNGTKRSIGIYSHNNKNIAFTGGQVEAIGINNANKEGDGILYYAYSATYVNSLMVSGNALTRFVGNTYAVAKIPSESAPSGVGAIINGVKGNGWDNIDKSGDPEAISVNTEATECSYKSVEFGAAATYTQEPTAKTNLAYTGEAQELVNAGSSEQGTVAYRLGDSGEFSTSIPTGTDVGTYTVQYKILGDDGHIDSEIKSVEVDIANEPAPGPTPDPDPSSPSAKAGLPGGAIAAIVIGSTLILLGGVWALMMFVLNKWVKVGDKVVRAFKVFGIKKDNKYIVWGFPFKFVTREEAEIFKTKEEASK